METSLEPLLQDELDVLDAPKRTGVAHIKRETGDLDMTLPNTNSCGSLQGALNTVYNDDLRTLFASYSANANLNCTAGNQAVPESLPQQPSCNMPCQQSPSIPSVGSFVQQVSVSHASQPVQTSSITWYKQPSVVMATTHAPSPSVHSSNSTVRPSTVPPQTRTADSLSQAASLQGAGCPSVNSDSCRVKDTPSSVNSMQVYPSAEDKEEKPPMIVQGDTSDMKHSVHTTRQVSKASAERVETTTRRLRARQSTRQQQEAAAVSRLTTAPDSHSLPSESSPSFPQVAETLPPPAKVLRPRRMMRKPDHTQRVWRPDIQGEPVDKWRAIGQTQGLSSDTEIAVFLMQHYEKSMSGQPTGVSCVNCRAVLTLTCTLCHTPSQLMDTSKSSPSANTMSRLPEVEVTAKVEPMEDHSDGEPDSGSFEVEQEREDERQRREIIPARRKRGRPVGSGKKKSGNIVRSGGGSGISDGKVSDMVDSSIENGDSGGGGGGGSISTNKVTLKNSRKYKCTYDGCEAAFAKSSRLKIHTRIHTGEKPYVCKECSKAFTQKSGLTVHMQKHTGLRPFTCDECSSTFPSSSTLKQHMRRHTGEKPFACKKCDKTFRWSGHLTQHMRMHDGIKPFLCPDCGKSFSASSDLVKHRVTHTKSRPYKCDVCNKAYAFQHRLTAHQRSHTGDRPFLCSECGAAFSRAHNLTVHMRTHTGDKPYKCNDCGAKFSDSGNFCKHKKTKHGENSKLSHSKPGDLPSVADPAESSDLTHTVEVPQLSHYDHLLQMTKLPEYSGTETGKLPSMAKVAGKLPSMAKVAGKTKRERDRRGFLPVGSVALSSSMPQAHTLSTDGSTLSPHHSMSPPTNIDEFKSLLPPLGSDQPSPTLPSQLPPTMQLSSPPPLPVQSQVAASPALSPSVSIAPQSSPGPCASGDSRVSPMPQPDQTDYQVPQHDGVVFPPQYYGNYPYYYQQQQQ